MSSCKANMRRSEVSLHPWYKKHLSFAMVFMLLFVVGILSIARPSLAAKKDQQPNIVFLLTDDQRWDTLGCMGNKIIQTPHVDRLARQGVMFTNCFVTTSICMTNRACILTGQYAARHGVIDFRTSFTPRQLAATYPALLKEGGYHIGFIGKWGVGQPPKQLFDYNRGWPGQSKYFHNIDGKTVHLTQIMSDQAMEFFDELPEGQEKKPFCLSISFKAPHVQDNDPRQFLYDPRLEDLYRDVTIPPPALGGADFFNSLPEFLKTSENRRRWERRFATPEAYQRSVKGYYRLITGVDHVVGRIVARLEEEGLADNTVILYTGDNGFYLGERGFAGKWYPHEVSIRVPLVVYDPRLPAKQRGVTRDQTVLTFDMGPTMLDLAGIDPPNSMQGKSFLPLVEGKKPAWRTEFFYEHLFVHPKIPRNEGVRTAEFKYIRYLDSKPLFEELYDLKNDPDEAHNLATNPKYTKTLEEMRQKWQTWRERAK